MESFRPYFPVILAIVRVLGAALVAVGALRALSAPAVAARRAAEGFGGADGSSASDVRRRGLIDFLRISGALSVLAGFIVLLVSFIAA